MAKLRKKVKRNLSIVAILIVILVGFISFSSFYNKDNNTLNNPGNNQNEPEDPIKVYKASLIATGDGLIHSPIYEAAYNKETKTYDFSRMLTYTKEKIKDYDIRYYNQETVFDSSSPLGTFPRFNTPSEFGQNMIDIGFNLVSLATNHSMDCGAKGAKNSAAWWESKTDILATGMFSSSTARNTYPIKEVNGITYTMLSYTPVGTNGLGAAALEEEPFLVNLYDEEQIKKDIAAVRDKVDVLIVAMHWGNEYQQEASAKQREQAKFLADNGVDVVLGTHSHCIQPWEQIGDTTVFYSFGNFISNQMGADEALIRKVGVIGMFGTLDITKTVDTENNTTTIDIDNIGADLTFTYRFYNKDIGRNDYLVIPFSKMESKYLKNYESVYDEFSKVLKKYDSNITIEPLPAS